MECYLNSIIYLARQSKCAEIYIETSMEDKVQKRLNKNCLKKIKIFEGEDKAQIDFVVTVGGDGNLLWISKLFQKKKVPTIISFACGTRNFLCYYQVEHFAKVFDDLFFNIENNKNIFIDRRKRLKCSVIRENEVHEYYAFNEIVI